MKNIGIKNEAGLMTLALRWIIGWTYFSAFWRRTILANKLDPDQAGYIGEKFNHFLPNALGIKPLIQYLVENPELLWWNMLIFTLIEGIVGLLMILGLFTRLMGIGVFALAMGILLGSGWLGTTCLDEWQIGILGIATGFTLFLTGSGRYSVDHYLLKRAYPFTEKRWFALLGSGPLAIGERVLPKVVLIGSLFILGMALLTNQVFHGGLWGPLHNKSVKPKLEIAEGALTADRLSFEVFRTEGADVYGSWVIAIDLLDRENNKVLAYDQRALADLPKDRITNHYIAKVQPGKHSLVVPLGAKARLELQGDGLSDLPQGNYTLRITDISGATWVHPIEK